MAYIGSITWVVGFVLAKGFWSTLACIFPLWSYYIVVEFVLMYFGIV